jgi:hypothetical protein
MPAAAVSTAASATAAVSTAAVSAAAVSTTAFDKLQIRPSQLCGFLVEDVERREADVRDLFFTESNFVTRHRRLRRHIRRRSTDCGRCATHQ